MMFGTVGFEEVSPLKLFATVPLGLDNLFDVGRSNLKIGKVQ